MKKFPLSLIAIALIAVFPIDSHAETDLDRIDARLQALEKRAEQAERRAAAAERKAQKLEQLFAVNSNAMTEISVMPENSTIAENKAKDLKTAVSSPMTQESQPVAQPIAQPITTGIKYNDEFGELKIYGDVEFNMDSASRKGQITSVRTALGKDNEPNKSDIWDINGRILIGLDGVHSKANGHYAGFSVQPLADMTGKMNLDDAVFYFGQRESWEAKLGRYEAYDMFPLGQDTFIQYSGNTSNELYGDGFGYIYMMKEGRGRSGDGGSVQLSKSVNDWYFEVNALIEDGTALFNDGTFHGYQLDNKKNVIYLRPVIAWQPNNVKVAVAMESQVIRNAYGDTVGGKWEDMSKRNGYGMTLGWNSLEKDPENGLQLAFSTAYLDATSEKDLSVGGYGLWQRLQIGYIFAHNDIKDFNENIISANPNSILNTTPGKYNIHTLYTSYELPKILELDNYKIYLGAYYSQINTDHPDMVNSHDDNRYGVRARFKYFF